MTGETGIILKYIPRYLIMLIRQVSCIIMAVDTVENGIIAWGGMTVCTAIPLFVVLATVNGEVHSVVIKSRRYPSVLTMAGFTIRREVCYGVIGVIRSVIVIAMAPEAGIGGIIVIAVMAVVAITGNSGMRAREGIVLIVVERRRHPRIFGMALLAVRREAGCSVAGAAGGIIVIAMAPKAGIGGVVEITIMAVHAVVSDGGMRASQRIILVVYIKGSRGPVRSSGMA